MRVFAIADLHLYFGTPDKNMGVFGADWIDHPAKIEKNWRAKIKDDDLVLIAGDISWAHTTLEAVVDLMWIHELPGTKVMIRGNHESWWSSVSKARTVCPDSIHLIHNDAFTMNDVTVGGARLWENEAMSFEPHIDFQPSPEGVKVHKEPNTPQKREHDQRVFAKELNRLRASIDAMDKDAKHRIVMTHYPPINPQHEENEITRLFHNEGITHCLYGHLHHLKPNAPVNGKVQDTQFIFTACDYLNFNPVELVFKESKVKGSLQTD